MPPAYVALNTGLLEFPSIVPARLCKSDRLWQSFRTCLRVRAVRASSWTATQVSGYLLRAHPAIRIDKV
eukprot:352554-Chlamydomonas_euryale.AAC.8